MQTIARANRVNEGKSNGLIVDYIGIVKALRKALADYTKDLGGQGGDDPTVDKEELIARILETIEKANDKGYVETLYGRRRYLGAELNSRNANIRDFAYRAAINAPLQGTSADIIKMAMVELHKKLKNYKSKMILQIHVELVLEVPENELEEVKKLTVEAMEMNQPLKVPLKVEVGYGKTWMEK